MTAAIFEIILQNLYGSITMCSQRNTELYSVRQHNHLII